MGQPFELRVKLTEAFAKALRLNPADTRMTALSQTLQGHNASLYSIIEEFRHWVADPANRHSPDERTQGLLAMTLATLADEQKAARWARAYKIEIAGCSAFFEGNAAIESLERDLAALIKSDDAVIEKTRRAYFPPDGKMHGVIAPNFGEPR
jgi:hypothetical protein